VLRRDREEWLFLSLPRIALILLCIAFSFTAEAQDTSEDQKDRAKELIDGVSEKFGSSDKVEQNLTNPLTSGSSFTTLDGSQSFNQQLSCPSSSSFLELFYALGAGGDLAPVIVKQDTDFDGEYDYNFTLPVPVSGVCANGIISCNNGTWSNCSYHLWNAGTNDRLGLKEANLADLAGCYCVNNSCGSSLAFGNRYTILDDLAGGMSGALMQRDPRYAISAVDKQDFVIKLSGQDTRTCSPDTTTPQHNYYQNAVTMADDAFTASAGDEVYGLVTGIPSGDDALLTTNACTIERTVDLEEILATDIFARVTSTPDYEEYACSGDEDCFEFGLGNDEDDHIRQDGCNIFTERVVWNIDRIDRIKEATLLHANYEDQIAIRVNGQLIFNTGGFNGNSDPSDCQINDQASVSINRSFKSALQNGQNELVMKIAIKSRGSGKLYGRLRYEPSCELVESVANSCARYADNDACRIIEETVDGVKTFQNGGRTGLTPISQTRTLHGVKCSETFTREWFDRSRKYECEADAEDAMTFDFSRQEHIYANSSIDQFADLQEGSDGSYTPITGDYTIDTEYGIAECEEICKTQSDEVDAEVSSTGVVSDVLKDPEYTEYNYHRCSAGVCPVGPGETVVEDCGCLNEFPQAMAMMQTFRLAGKDLICTSGTKKPVQY